MHPLAALFLAPVAGLPLVAGCAHSPDARAPTEVVNFDDCLIAHMAAILMLDEASSEEDAVLRNKVIASQTELLSDDTLDEDELAQRTSTLLSSYGRAAEAAAAKACTKGTAPQTLAADAMSCGEALAQ